MNLLLIVIGVLAFLCNIAVIVYYWNAIEEILFSLEQKALILDIEFPVKKNNHRFGVPTRQEYTLLYQIDYELTKKLKNYIFVNRLLCSIFSITFLLAISIWYNLYIFDKK